MNAFWYVMAGIGFFFTVVYAVLGLLALIWWSSRPKGRKSVPAPLEVYDWDELPDEVKFDITAQLQAIDAEEAGMSAEERARRRWERR